MTKTYPTVTTWHGKELIECTRAELIDCINFLAPAFHERYSAVGSRAIALGKIEMWKRGEKTA